MASNQPAAVHLGNMRLCMARTSILQEKPEI